MARRLPLVIFALCIACPAVVAADRASPGAPFPDGPKAFARTAPIRPKPISPAEKARLFAVAEKLQPSLVLLDDPNGYGAGFVLSKKHRLVVTAAHVADGLYEAKSLVAIPDGTRARIRVEQIWYHPGTLRQLDKGLTLRTPDRKYGPVSHDGPDLAIVRLANSGGELPGECALATADEWQRLLGERIGKIGYTPAQGRPWRGFHDGPPPPALAGAGVMAGAADFSGSTSGPMAARKHVAVLEASLGPGDSGCPLFLENGHVAAVCIGGGVMHNPGEPAQQAAFGLRVDCIHELIAYYGLDTKFGLRADVGAISVPTEPATDPRIGTYWSAVTFVKQAQDSLASDDFHRAGELCNRAIGMAPDYWFAYLVRAKGYMAYATDDRITLSPQEKRKFLEWAGADAGRCYDKEVERSDSYLVYSRCRALSLSLFFAHQNHELLQNTNDLLDDTQLTHEQRAFGLANRSHARRNLGDLNSALADLNETIRLAPEEPAWYRDRAELWERLGRSDLAAADRLRATVLRSARRVSLRRQPPGSSERTRTP